MIAKPRTRPAQYHRVPRQVESHASSRLSLPTVCLVMAYVNSFAHRAAKHALLRPPATDIEHIIVTHRLAQDQIELDSFFAHLRPQPVEAPTTRGDEVANFISRRGDQLYDGDSVDAIDDRGTIWHGNTVVGAPRPVYEQSQKRRAGLA